MQDQTKPEAPPLRIALFGEPRLLTTTGSPVRIKSQRTAALLTFLTHFQSQEHSRERLIDLLWPDADPEAARARLRNTLSDLRRSIESAGAQPDAVLIATRTSVGWVAAAVQSDVAEFERLLRSAMEAEEELAIALLQQAVEKSAAEFASTLYDDWVIVERARLQHLRHSALKQLASLHLSGGRSAAAEETARILVREDPANEGAHDVVIAARIAEGDYSGARRQFAALEQVLRDEVGASPSMETRALIAAIPTESERSQPRVPPVSSSKAVHSPSKPATPASTMAANVRHGARFRLPVARQPLVAAAVVAIGWMLVFRPMPWTSRRSAAPTHRAASSTSNPSGLVPALPLLWETRIPSREGDGDSELSGVVVGRQNYIYLTGFVRTEKTDVDFETVKLNANGEVIWRRFYDGPGHDVDRARSLVVDGDENVYVIGDSDKGGGHGRGNTPGLDIALIKYDKYGNRSGAWPDVGFGPGVRRYNGPADGEELATKLLLDAKHNLYVLGSTESDKGHDVLLLKYDSRGQLVWHKIIGDPRLEDGPSDMAFDYQGNLLVVAASRTPANPKYAHWLTMKLSPADGKAIWEQRWGEGDSVDHQPSVVGADPSGNVFVTGCSAVPYKPGSGLCEFITVKYDSRGARKWEARDIVGAVYLGQPMGMYVEGWDPRRVLVAGNGAPNDYDAMVVCYGADGKKLWSDQFGGSKPNTRAVLQSLCGWTMCVSAVGLPTATGIGVVILQYSGDGKRMGAGLLDRPTPFPLRSCFITGDGVGNPVVAGTANFGANNDMFVAHFSQAPDRNKLLALPPPRP